MDFDEVQTRALELADHTIAEIEESEVFIPPASQMPELTGQMQIIVDEMIGLKVQSRKLGEIRDTLLPKPMSGEIDVSTVKLSKQLNYQLSK